VWSLRRRAERLDVGVDGRPGASWDEVSVRIGDIEDLAEEITWFGPDAVVLGPPDLRAAVVRRLRAVLAAHDRAQDPALERDGVAGAGAGAGQ
jgi:predicted DNA-binding transcriptional regulator YafY